MTTTFTRKLTAVVAAAAMGIGGLSAPTATASSTGSLDFINTESLEAIGGSIPDSDITPSTGIDIERLRGDLYNEGARLRSSRGLPVLRQDPELQRAGQVWVEKLVAEHDMYHQPGYFENLICGYGPVSASKVMDSWMNSPGHRSNLLQPDITRVGYGVAQNRASGYWCVAYVALW
ncbi:MAG: CAP domain-containing protein [Actinomycetia bacterium]|nr:CAP domain-containing protein [Actinomycetes bacterium]